MAIEHRFGKARGTLVGSLLLFLAASLVAQSGPPRAPATTGTAPGVSTRVAAPKAAPKEPTQAEIDARVEAMLQKMTPEQKIDLLGGVDGFDIRAIPSIGLPALHMADGPLGVRNWGPATAMPGGIALASTFDADLAERIGTEIGRDARAKGINFLLGPGVNIYLSPTNGRNAEYMGEDPFLAARLAVGYIRGVQSQGVSATVKHFMGNNSDFDRHRVNDVIDERTMREIYLPAFEAAVKEANVGAVMDSYNLVNGEHPTQNAHLNIDILKTDWGFKGVLMSDWFATYDGVAAANAGMDIEMPSGQFMNRDTLLPAISNGTVLTSTIDDKVRRILRTAVRFGWLDRDQTETSISRDNQQGDRVALEGAREAIVLLKNASQTLPLDRVMLSSVAVIGPDAYPAVPVPGGSARVFPFHAVSLLEGLTNELAGGAKPVPVYYDQGLPTMVEMAQATNFTVSPDGEQPGLHAEYYGNEMLQGAPSLRIEPHVAFGRTSPGHESGGLATLLPSLPTNATSERFTGYFTPAAAGPYTIVIQSTGEDGGAVRLYVDDKLVLDQWTQNLALMPSVPETFTAVSHKIVLEHHGRSAWLGGSLDLAIVREDALVRPEAVAMASKAGAVIVAVGFDPDSESEGSDRTFALPPGQEALIRRLAAANKRTIVVDVAGGAVDTSRWLDAVPAFAQAWYAGQEGGAAIADVLLGTVNPSGRLPISWERRLEDNPAHANYYPAPGQTTVTYANGVFVGYRGYEKNGVKPLFAFGYGLSYTTFKYANLTVASAAGSRASAPRSTVSFDVTNSGSRAGTDVAQVYVGQAHARVPRPLKELKGFSRVTLNPGETKHVSVSLDRRAFAYYDTTVAGWTVDPGAFEIQVGRASDDILLKSTLNVK